MTLTSQSAVNALTLRRYIFPVIILCSTVCLATSAARAQGLSAARFDLTKSAVGRTPGMMGADIDPRLELSMAEPSKLAFRIGAQEDSGGSANPSGLLISMIDDKATMPAKRSESVSARSAGVAGSGSFDLYKSIVDDQKSSRFGFLSWMDFRTIVLNPTDRDLFRASTSFGADAPASEDRSTPEFKPLAEVHVGDYRLPIFLRTTDAQDCCR